MFRRAGIRQVKSLRRKRRDLFERAGAALPIEEVRIRKARRVLKSSIVERHQNEPIRLAIRQRLLNTTAVQHAEYRGIRSDAEAQE